MIMTHLWFVTSMIYLSRLSKGHLVFFCFLLTVFFTIGVLVFSCFGRSLARKRLEVFFTIFFMNGLGRREISISPVSVVPTSPGKLWSFVFMFVPDAMDMHYEYYLFQGPNQVPKSCVRFKVGAPQAPMFLGEQVPTTFSQTWSTYALGTPCVEKLLLGTSPWRFQKPPPEELGDNLLKADQVSINSDEVS